MADWELCKENAQPSRGGRKVSTLVSALSRTRADDHALELEREEFEKAILDKSGPDPLLRWLGYIRWLKENFPSGSKDIVSVYEACTREFKDDERYANDERYVKVWIAYADTLPNPSEVFKFMRANKIGRKVALYYVATAWTAERRGNFPLADKAYVKGIDVGAKPLSLLKKRFREFQRRMSRHWLNNQGNESGRRAHREDRTLGRDRKKERKFGVISSDQARVGASRQPRRRQHDNGGFALRSVQASSAAEGAENAKPVSAAPAFQVFAEASDNADTVDLVNHFFSGGATEDTSAAPVRWDLLPSRDARSKENTTEATPWAGQKLKQRSGAALPGATPVATPFAIFVDDSNKEISPVAPLNYGDLMRGGGGLRERTPQVEKPENELLLKNPLVKFSDAYTPKPKNGVSSKGLKPTAHSAYVSPATQAPSSSRKRSSSIASRSRRLSSGGQASATFKKQYHKSPISAQASSSDGEVRWKALVDSLYSGANSEEDELCFEEIRARSLGILK